jgi:hypothetical protein
MDGWLGLWCDGVTGSNQNKIEEYYSNDSDLSGSKGLKRLN